MNIIITIIIIIIIVIVIIIVIIINIIIIIINLFIYLSICLFIYLVFAVPFFFISMLSCLYLGRQSQDHQLLPAGASERQCLSMRQEQTQRSLQG